MVACCRVPALMWVPSGDSGRERARLPQSAAPPRSCRQLRACPPAAAASCTRGMLLYELGETRPARTKCSQKNHVAVFVGGCFFLPSQTPWLDKQNTRPMMRLLLCCLVAFGDAQLRPRRVGVSPMGEETGAAEAGGAEPDMANLMKNMMGGGAARSKCSQQLMPPPTAPEAHALAHGCLWAR